MLQLNKNTNVRRYPIKIETPRWNIGIIDDDPFFHFLMKKIVDENYIQLNSYYSLADIGDKRKIESLDVVIVDYFIDNFNGIEIAQYLASFFSKIPVVLISGQSKPPSTEGQWPTCIQAYLPKSIGALAILKNTIHILEGGRNIRYHHPIELVKN